MSQQNPIDQKLEDTLSALEVVLKIYFAGLTAQMMPFAFRFLAAFSLWTVSLALIALVIDAMLDNRIAHARWMSVSAFIGLASSALILKSHSKRVSNKIKNETVQFPTVSHI